MSEMRRDMISKAWAIIAPARAQRVRGAGILSDAEPTAVAG